MSELFRRFGSPQHFWCEDCGKTQPVEMRDLRGLDNSGRFLGGDLVCLACGSIIATYGYPVTAETGTIALPLRRRQTTCA